MSGKLLTLKCDNCGGALRVEQNQSNLYVCEHCGSNVLYIPENESSKTREKELLKNAICNFELEDYKTAYSLFKEMTKQYADNYKGWLGALLCEVKFADLASDSLERRNTPESLLFQNTNLKEFERRMKICAPADVYKMIIPFEVQYTQAEAKTIEYMNECQAKYGEEQIEFSKPEREKRYKKTIDEYNKKIAEISTAIQKTRSKRTARLWGHFFAGLLKSIGVTIAFGIISIIVSFIGHGLFSNKELPNQWPTPLLISWGACFLIASIGFWVSYAKKSKNGDQLQSSPYNLSYKMKSLSELRTRINQAETEYKNGDQGHVFSDFYVQSIELCKKAIADNRKKKPISYYINIMKNN